MMRVKASVVSGVLAFAAVFPAAAQEQSPTGSRSWLAGLSHYGKWPMLVSAAGFTTLAIVRHDDADQVFGSLLEFCRNAGPGCRITSEGQYADPNAETLFNETVRLDRQARLWLVAGQVTLAAAGGMFLIDLVSGDSRPKNIPYTGFKVLSAPGRLGLSFEF